MAAVLPSKTRRLPGKKKRHPAAAIGAEVEGGEEQGEAEAEAGRAEEEGAVAKQKARGLGKIAGGEKHVGCGVMRTTMRLCL